MSGWITRTRERFRGKKRKKENEGDDQSEQGREEGLPNKQAPERMPYEIWDHITRDDWEAFVTQKNSPQEIVST